MKLQLWVQNYIALTVIIVRNCDDKLGFSKVQTEVFGWHPVTKHPWCLKHFPLVNEIASTAQQCTHMSHCQGFMPHCPCVIIIPGIYKSQPPKKKGLSVKDIGRKPKMESCESPRETTDQWNRMAPTRPDRNECNHSSSQPMTLNVF